MEIHINSDAGTAWRLPYTSAELAAILRAMREEFSLIHAGDPRGEHGDSGGALEFALLSESEMSGLNEDFLGCSGPTNILAFPAPQEGLAQDGPARDARPRPLGWLAMSAQTMRREAMLFKQELPAYTLRLLAHGLAHLLGYEHGELMDVRCARVIGAAAARGTLK